MWSNDYNLQILYTTYLAGNVSWLQSLCIPLLLKISLIFRAYDIIFFFDDERARFCYLLVLVYNGLLYGVRISFVKVLIKFLKLNYKIKIEMQGIINKNGTSIQAR